MQLILAQSVSMALPEALNKGHENTRTTPVTADQEIGLVYSNMDQNAIMARSPNEDIILAETIQY